MEGIKTFFSENFKSFNRDPFGYAVDFAFRVVTVGFGLWLILTASRCSINIVSSAL